MTIYYSKTPPNIMNFQRAFDNLKAMSVSQTECLTEWKFVIRCEDENHCICGKRLTNCNIYFNNQTGKEIVIGDSCISLLKLKKQQKKDKLNVEITDKELETIIETRARDKKDYCIELIDLAINRYKHRISKTLKSMILWDIYCEVDKINSLIIDNLNFKKKLEEVKNEAYAKWVIRKEFCNDCYQKIGDYWVKHKCENDVACSRIKDKICEGCQYKSSSSTMKLCGVVNNTI